MEEKLHHIIFGEKLGHRCQFIGADLFPGGINLIFALGLPELVGPTECVVGSEYFGWEGCEQFAQLYLVIEGNGEIEYWIVTSENTRECVASETTGEIETISRTEFWG